MSRVGAGTVWGQDEKGARFVCVRIWKGGYRGQWGSLFFRSRAASRLIGALVAPLPPLLKHVTDDKRKQH